MPVLLRRRQGTAAAQKKSSLFPGVRASPPLSVPRDCPGSRGGHTGEIPARSSVRLNETPTGTDFQQGEAGKCSGTGDDMIYSSSVRGEFGLPVNPIRAVVRGARP